MLFCFHQQVCLDSHDIHRGVVHVIIRQSDDICRGVGLVTVRYGVDTHRGVGLVFISHRADVRRWVGLIFISTSVDIRRGVGLVPFIALISYSLDDYDITGMFRSVIFRRNATHCISPYAIVVCECVCMCVCVCVCVSICMPRLWTPGKRFEIDT